MPQLSAATRWFGVKGSAPRWRGVPDASSPGVSDVPGGPQPAEEALTFLAHGCQPSGGLWTPSVALALARFCSWAVAIRTASASTPTRLCAYFRV